MGDRRILLAAALALVFLPRFSSAQESKGAAAPYLSRLKAEVVGFQVKLTWEEAPGTEGTVLVYRSPAEITAENRTGALLLGRVATGLGYYTDTPPDRGSYFYAVLLQDPGGKLNSLLSPYRNKTTVGVAVRATASEEKAAAHITAIKAEVSQEGQSIEISFHSSATDRDLLLFWGTAPMRTAKDLLRSTAKTQLGPGTTRYIIPTLQGVDFWFAVLDSGLYKVGEAPLQPGENATMLPVQVPLDAEGAALAAPDTRRPQPLPTLKIDFGVESGNRLEGADAQASPPGREISADTEMAIAQLLQRIEEPALVERKPQVLPFDRTPSPGGELSLLEDIVTGPFTAGDMAEAEKQLADFLSLRRAPKVEARAHFYLAQVYYFQDRVREALLEFLLSEESFYHETEPWKDACFRRLEAEP